MATVNLSSAIHLLRHIQSFLLISFHSLLYARSLYPQETFLAARAFNLAVRQSRHPGICQWIKDAVSAICAQLEEGSVDKVVFVVLAPPVGSQVLVLERWVFDLSYFPCLPKGAWQMAHEKQQHQDKTEGALQDVLVDQGLTGEKINWANVTQSLRGAVQKLQTIADGASPVPHGSTFTIAIETKNSKAPVGYSQSWIPANVSRPGDDGSQASQPDNNTIPVRAFQAGPMFCEIYMEETSKKPQSPATSKKSPSQSVPTQDISSSPSQDNI